MAKVYDTIQAETAEDMKLKVEAYFREYHPWGYGTKVVETYRFEAWTEDNPAANLCPRIHDNLFTVKVERWSSCG